MTVCINGKIYSDKEATVPFLDHGYLYVDGAFATLRTYNQKLFRIKEHLGRLFESCKLINLKIPYSRIKIINWTTRCYGKSKLKEARIRIQVTRGAGEVPIDKTKTCKPIISILVSALPTYNPKNYEKGVKVITVKMERTIPKSKNLNFLPSIMAILKAQKENAFEAILLDSDGFATEGTTSNIFIVKNGVLITPSTEILEGVTRKVVLELAKKEKVKTKLKNLKTTELFKADEIFLTGTTKEIVPVIRINNKKVNKGKIGSITRTLTEAFQTYVKAY